MKFVGPLTSGIAGLNCIYFPLDVQQLCIRKTLGNRRETPRERTVKSLQIHPPPKKNRSIGLIRIIIRTTRRSNPHGLGNKFKNWQNQRYLTVAKTEYCFDSISDEYLVSIIYVWRIISLNYDVISILIFGLVNHLLSIFPSHPQRESLLESRR